MSDEVLLSESARMLGVPYAVVYYHWRAGKVPYHRRGRWVWVRVSDVTKAVAGYRKKELVMPVVRAEYQRH